jgi:putative FmdB family regulatory protein
MPIYAYKCAECGHQLEQLQKVGAPLLVDCPQCSRPALVKQLTAAGFQLKGSGWYVTDFRDKPQVKKDGVAPAKDGDGSAAETPAGDKPATDKPSEGKPAESKADPTPAAGKTDKAAKSEKGTGAASPAPAPSPTPPPAAGNTGSTA